MPIDNPPKIFITNPGSMLPYRIQTELLNEKRALNNNPQVMKLAMGRLDEETREAFVRLPCEFLQTSDILALPGRSFAFYMWLLGYANNLKKPRGDKKTVYCDLDQWLKAGFIVTARRQKDLQEELSVSAETIRTYNKALKNAHFVRIVNPYKTAHYLNMNVYILGYKVAIGDNETTIWLAELRNML